MGAVRVPIYTGVKCMMSGRIKRVEISKPTEVRARPPPDRPTHTIMSTRTKCPRNSFFFPTLAPPSPPLDDANKRILETHITDTLDVNKRILETHITGTHPHTHTGQNCRHAHTRADTHIHAHTCARVRVYLRVCKLAPLDAPLTRTKTQELISHSGKAKSPIHAPMLIKDKFMHTRTEFLACFVFSFMSVVCVFIRRCIVIYWIFCVVYWHYFRVRLRANLHTHTHRVSTLRAKPSRVPW
jgi:hypothetical protein